MFTYLQVILGNLWQCCLSRRILNLITKYFVNSTDSSSHKISSFIALKNSVYFLQEQSLNWRERKLFQEYIIIQNKSVSERWQTTLIENKCSASGCFYSQTAHFLKKNGWKSLEMIKWLKVRQNYLVQRPNGLQNSSFLLQRNRQMKAGQNTKYDITKTWRPEVL